MKITKHLLIGVSTLVLALTSLVNINHHLKSAVNLEEIAEELGAEYLNSDEGLTLLHKSSESDFYVFLESRGTELSRIFRLQSKSHSIEDLFIEFTSFELLHFEGNLIINGRLKNNKKQLIALAVNDKVIPKIGEPLFDNIYDGYGLVDRSGKWQNQFSFEASSGLSTEGMIVSNSLLLSETDKIEQLKSLEFACSSGGPGSTSCSYSANGQSCSVTCGAGYYACCTATVKCQCVAIEPE